MTSLTIILHQFLNMFILILVGFILRKTNVVADSAVESFSNIVLYVSTPALIINSFQMPFTGEFLTEMKVFIILTIVTNVLAIILAIMLCQNRKDWQYLIAFGNTSFIGIPLVASLFGSREVVLMSLYVSLGNLFIWTYGISLFTGKLGKDSLKKILLHPSNVALLIGFLFAFKLLPLPTMVFEITEILAGMNLPIIMIVLGCYFTEINLKTILKDKMMLGVTFYRLILVPFIMMGCLTVLNVVDLNSYLVLVIAHATPGATLAAVFAKKAKMDAEFSIGFILISTLLSIVTLPLIMEVAKYLYQT